MVVNSYIEIKFSFFEYSKLKVSPYFILSELFNEHLRLSDTVMIYHRLELLQII